MVFNLPAEKAEAIGYLDKILDELRARDSQEFRSTPWMQALIARAKAKYELRKGG